jgi:hypothetical protein
MIRLIPLTPLLPFHFTIPLNQLNMEELSVSKFYSFIAGIVDMAITFTFKYISKFS